VANHLDRLRMDATLDSHARNHQSARCDYPAYRKSQFDKVPTLLSVVSLIENFQQLCQVFRGRPIVIESKLFLEFEIIMKLLLISCEPFRLYIALGVVALCPEAISLQVMNLSVVFEKQSLQKIHVVLHEIMHYGNLRILCEEDIFTATLPRETNFQFLEDRSRFNLEITHG
jgi:hypothetical protein